MSRFTEVPTDEALSAVRDKLKSGCSLGERTRIPTDNITDILTFYVQTCLQVCSDISTGSGLGYVLQLSPATKICI